MLIKKKNQTYIVWSTKTCWLICTNLMFSLDAIIKPLNWFAEKAIQMIEINSLADFKISSTFLISYFHRHDTHTNLTTLWVVSQWKLCKIYTAWCEVCLPALSRAPQSASSSSHPAVSACGQTVVGVSCSPPAPPQTSPRQSPSHVSRTWTHNYTVNSLHVGTAT